MIALITADLHLKSEMDTTSRTGMQKSISTFKNQLQFLHRIAELKPELFIIAGDLLDYYIYSNYQKELIINAFKKLKDSGISTILIQGNHDIDYTLLEELENFCFLIANKNLLNNKILVEFKIVYEIQKIDNTIFHFVNYNESRDFLNMIKLENNLYNVLIMHSVINGLKADKNTPVIFTPLTISDFKDFHHVFTGHIHYMQSIKNITTIGSPYLVTSLDYNVIIYDTESGKHKRVSLR